MPADLSVDLAALDALWKAATPGEWTFSPETQEVCIASPTATPVIACLVESGVSFSEDLANGALIAALHNAWPEMRRRLEIGDAAVEAFAAQERADALNDQHMDGAGSKHAAVMALREARAARARLRALRETSDAA